MVGAGWFHHLFYQATKASRQPLVQEGCAELSREEVANIRCVPAITWCWKAASNTQNKNTSFKYSERIQSVQKGIETLRRSARNIGLVNATPCLKGQMQPHHRGGCSRS